MLERETRVPANNRQVQAVEKRQDSTTTGPAEAWRKVSVQRKYLKSIGRVLLLFLCLADQPALGQLEERHLDSVQVLGAETQVAIFYPTIGTIKSLLALREEGLLPTEGLVVVGVYHSKETSDYEAARRYVDDSGLTWVKFHRVNGELSPTTIYRENSCTADFVSIVEKTDGAILFGGPDIPPECYGQETRLLTVIEDRYRHYLNLSFAFHLLGGGQEPSFTPLLAAHPDYPLLGICLGAQTINVAAGGTLVQDIWQQLYHEETYEGVLRLGPRSWHTNPFRRLYPDSGLLGYEMHPIKLRAGEPLWQEWGFAPTDSPYVVSAHHQAVARLGKDIRVAATSADGRVVEAIVHRKCANVLGVQFHPDFAILWNPKLRFTFAPGGVETSLRAILETHPPSLAFNRQVWSWFFAKAQEYHAKRR